MNVHEKLAAALDHLSEDERQTLMKDFRNAILEKAASVLDYTDDGRCGLADCCGLHADDFASIIRAMKAK
ncbi:MULTISPECIES: hypothetical protein [Streptomyces]|uniref:hypothetical protein n=1 Tax=Streptomyces TaxID=1883 RepID=UPI002E2E013C|nr:MULTISPECIES: hypothetical protein [Streptomyces]